MSETALARAADRISEKAAGEAWSVSIGTGTVTGYTALSREATVAMDSDGGTMTLPIAVHGYVAFVGDRVLVAGPVGAPHVVGVIDRGADVALIFDGDAVRAVNPANTAGRDLYARRFRGDLGGPDDGYNGYGVWHGNVDWGGVPGTYVSSGQVQSAGEVTAGTHVRATLDVTAGRNVSVPNGNINAGVSIAAGVNVLAGGTVSDGQGNVRVPPPSERALKDHRGELADALDVVRRWRPARVRWADPELRQSLGDREFSAVYVDEVAESAPEAVYDRGDGTRTTDDRALIAYLTAAVQTLADRLDALEA